MTGRSHNNTDAREYQEAISQWQLAARTEVKKFSSLPSAMFDTCDPMLEACLADPAERMMHRLHEPETQALAESAQIQQIELRVEKVTSEELRDLRKMRHPERRSATEAERARMIPLQASKSEYHPLLTAVHADTCPARSTAARWSGLNPRRSRKRSMSCRSSILHEPEKSSVSPIRD